MRSIKSPVLRRRLRRERIFFAKHRGNGTENIRSAMLRTVMGRLLRQKFLSTIFLPAPEYRCGLTENGKEFFLHLDLRCGCRILLRRSLGHMASLSALSGSKNPYDEFARYETQGPSSPASFKGLSPNAISPTAPEFRPKSSQNLLAYLPDRPQDLFNDFVSKFRSFIMKAHSATDPAEQHPNVTRAQHRVTSAARRTIMPNFSALRLTLPTSAP